MYNILITGVGGPAGRALVEQFSQREDASDFTLVGADMSPVELPGLSYCAKVPAANSPAYLPAMREIIGGIRADLIIPTVQDELPSISATTGVLITDPGHDRPWSNPPVVISAPGPSLIASDKLLTMWALQEAGVAVPAFAPMNAYVTAQHALDAIGTPMIVKPRVSRGGRGVEIVESAEDLEWDPENASLLLQEFAPGEEYCPQLYRSPITGDVEVFVLRKTELKQGRVGNAVSVDRVDGPEVADIAWLAEAAANALDLTGPLDMDIRRLATGEPVVLEVNARFGANSSQTPELLEMTLRDYLLTDHV